MKPEKHWWKKMPSCQIYSITNRQRQSNIEILRILAMFLVLVVHAAFWATGAPDKEDLINAPLQSFTKTAFESISIVCVNVFILISGWFGIKPSVKGFCNYLFQCAFFLFGIYILFLATGQATISFKGIAGCLCLTKVNWFIRAYAALYILSPVLNCFVDKASQKQFKHILIVFFIFQTIWGWSGAAKFIEVGYSSFSFIGLYLLARYVRLYGAQKLSTWGGYIYVASVILNTVGYYLCVMLQIPIDIYAYVNPLVIFGALGLLLFFSRIIIKPNKHINWVARSSFAVFLLHSNPNIGEPIFKEHIENIYANLSGIECIMCILGFLLIVYVVAIVLDQPRKWLWKPLSRYLPK